MNNTKHLSNVTHTLRRAIKHHQKGELQRAEAIYSQVLQIEPSNADALHLLGVVAGQRGRNEIAVGLIEKAINIINTIPLYHYSAGNAYRALDKLAQAIDCYQRALALNPNYFEALYNLGEAFQSQGKVGDAIGCYQRVLSLKPDYYIAYNNLGSALQDQGKLDEAIACYQYVLSLNPDYYMAHTNLGNALKEQGKLDEAIACYQHALSLKPDYYITYNNLGSALQDQGKLDEAIACYQHALSLKPDYYKALNNLGNALKEQGKLDEAIACYNRSLSLKPDYYIAYNNLGIALQSQGKFGEAVAAYRKATSSDENFTAAYLNLTECRTFTEADSEIIATLHKMLERAEIKDEDAANLRFSLGKIHDDMGRYGEAFSEYSEANRLKNKNCKFDRDKHSGRISRLMEIFTPGFFEERRDFGSDSDLPIMVLGMPRSGTTLVEQIVASHPRVCGAGELDFWNATARKHTFDTIPATTDNMVASIAGEFIDYLRSFSKTARYITDKMPNNYLHVGLIHLVFPKVRIIHVQRNPVDTCLSIYFHKFLGKHYYSYDLDNLVFVYKQYQRLMSHWRDVLPSEVFYEVNYEDLIKDQEKISRELIRFCGLTWDEKCLRFHLTERPVKTSSCWQVRQPIYKSSVARWMNYRQFLGPLADLLTEN